MVGGIELETLYWYILLVCAGLSLLFFFIGDILSFDGPIDPVLIVPWLAFTSLFGYLGERLVEEPSWLIFFISAAISSLLVFLLNFYVLLPLRNAESTLSFSEKELEGRVATVITPIPATGMGEIQIKSVTGSFSRPAAFYESQEKETRRGESVLIIEVKNRVCYVVPYKGEFKI